ncbi:hypothetical protein M413DRAFT_13028 [Hebeloma cylindrosporum]|uniref:JmjC domain-containing protein n=1 Tax=Hebeloma cylindrosporum TaxID=76867 RepID=A0A0C3C199_HEBCY|nr:hypothetical protein M413DRAFT_13028 [Hebeloma cylindrosporum h7]
MPSKKNVKPKTVVSGDSSGESDFPEYIMPMVKMRTAAPSSSQATAGSIASPTGGQQNRRPPPGSPEFEGLPPVTIDELAPESGDSILHPPAEVQDSKRMRKPSEKAAYMADNSGSSLENNLGSPAPQKTSKGKGKALPIQPAKEMEDVSNSVPTTPIPSKAKAHPSGPAKRKHSSRSSSVEIISPSPQVKSSVDSPAKRLRLVPLSPVPPPCSPPLAVSDDILEDAIKESTPTIDDIEVEDAAEDVEDEVLRNIYAKLPKFQDCQLTPFASAGSSQWGGDTSLVAYSPLFEDLEDVQARNVANAVNFRGCGQFVNPTRDSITTVIKESARIVLASNRRPAVFITAGVVRLSRIFEPMVTSNDRVRAIQLYPFAYEYQRMLGFIGTAYGKNRFFGQVTPEVALSFQTRKETTSNNAITQSPKKPAKWFVKSKVAAPSTTPEIFPASKLFDEPVVIYDARKQRFRFSEKDFNKLSELPTFTTDPEPDSIAAVAYTVNAFSYSQQKAAPPTETALSFNILFAIILATAHTPERARYMNALWTNKVPNKGRLDGLCLGIVCETLANNTQIQTNAVWTPSETRILHLMDFHMEELANGTPTPFMDDSIGINPADLFIHSQDPANETLGDSLFPYDEYLNQPMGENMLPPEEHASSEDERSWMKPFWTQASVTIQLPPMRTLGRTHFAHSVDLYDRNVAKMSPTHAFIRSALRDVQCDRYAGKTSTEISSAEPKSVGTTGHASEVCSLFTAYRLVDIIYSLECSDISMTAPQHKRLPGNFGPFKGTKYFADWTLAAVGFQKGVDSRMAMAATQPAFETHSSRQLYALYNLHTIVKNNKPLFNLQLAATHIAFMLDHDSSGKVFNPDYIAVEWFMKLECKCVPDLPSSMAELEASNSMASVLPNEMVKHFHDFLSSLTVDQKFEHLRLPLQLAALISPIFLLLEVQIHKSDAFRQRYKLLLYAKCLGNERPESVVALEKVIWNALFRIACGADDVYGAARTIAAAIPDILESSVPKDWPLASFLLPPTVTDEPTQDVNPSAPPVPPAPMEVEVIDANTAPPSNNPASDAMQAQNLDPANAPASNDLALEPMQVEKGDHTNNPVLPIIPVPPNPTLSNTVPPNKPDIPSKRPSRNVAKRDYADIGSSGRPHKQKKAKRNPSQARPPRVAASRDLRLDVQSRGPLPIVFGSQYMKVDVIDLTNIESIGRQTLFHIIQAFNHSGECKPFHFEFLEPMDHLSFNLFMAEVSSRFIDGKPKHVIRPDKSRLAIIPKDKFDGLRTAVVHNQLRTHHIVIPDKGVDILPFNRHGLRQLDSLDAVVCIEDQTMARKGYEIVDPPNISRLVSGTMRQFIDHADSASDRKVLRIIRMPSETAPSHTAFSSDFVSWRETKSRVYCKEEDPSLIKVLRWNDIATTFSAQWWTLIPYGFGAFFDVRAGSIWIVIAGAPQGSSSNYFAQPGHFLPSFDRTKVINNLPIEPEAIVLTEGMRIILPPNSIYAVFTTENCIISGGYYLSIPNLPNTLYGIIHSFILGSAISDENAPRSALYVRRIIHYLHTSLVVHDRRSNEDEDDYHHLLTFQDLKNDAGEVVREAWHDLNAFFSLFALAIFINALDERTYMPFAQAASSLTPEDQQRQLEMDLNAIPHIERRHCCYVRGLAFDLVYWFFNHYELKGPTVETSDAYTDNIVPLISRLGVEMVRYKYKAHQSNILGVCKPSQFEKQVKMALFAFPGMEEQYKEIMAHEQQEDWKPNGSNAAIPMLFSFEGTSVMALDAPSLVHTPVDDYFQAGKNRADNKYFYATNGPSAHANSGHESQQETEEGVISGEEEPITTEGIGSESTTNAIECHTFFPTYNARMAYNDAGNSAPCSIINNAQLPPHPGDMDIDGMPIEQRFRHYSLVAAAYPWLNGIIMEPSFKDAFPKDHYGFRFAEALDQFDINLATMSHTHAFVKTALRDIHCDRFAGKTSAEIIPAESQTLRSTGHASDISSMLTGYRLVDIMYELEHPDNAPKAPQHQRLHVNFSSFKGTKQLADWTQVATNFHRGFTASTTLNSNSSAFTNYSSRQLHALYNLHTNMRNNKPLFNLQLAATHIAFMLDHDSGGKENHGNKDFQDVPDLPSSLPALEGFNSLVPDSNDILTEFNHFLGSLAVDQKFDYLRLPLQLAALISPIFLLMGVQIHKSEAYRQRYRLILYSKCLGNARPKSVACLEKVIWKALFDIACGKIDVYKAAEVISAAIPNVLSMVSSADKSWFYLANVSDKDQIHLASFSVIESSVPKHWPVASILTTAPPIEGVHGSTEHSPPTPGNPPHGDTAMEIDLPVPEAAVVASCLATSLPSHMEVDESHLSSPNGQNPSLRRSERQAKSTPTVNKAPPAVPLSAHKRKAAHSKRQKPTPFIAKSEDPRPHPLVFGSKYMEFNIIDLTQIEASINLIFVDQRSSPTLDLLSPDHEFQDVKESRTFVCYDALGKEYHHTAHFYRTNDCDSFMNLLSSVTTHYQNAKPKHVSDPDDSFLTIMNQTNFSKMSPSSVQIHLQKHVIVIPDTDLPAHPFGRHGIRDLNSLNIDVQIEDQSLLPSASTCLRTGSLQQFVDNAESKRGSKILRVIHAPSDSVQQMSFTTEYLAWRETRSLTYCKEENYSSISTLRWNDFSNTDAVQWWNLVPHGFGAFLDVRSGSQLIIVAAPASSPSSSFNPDDFATSEIFIPGFLPTRAIHPVFFHPEAILLTEGMRIILPPNTIYATLTLANCVVTGGYYLSSHTLSSSLYGLIHSFILGASVANPDDILPDDEYHHLLTFKDIHDESGAVVKRGMDDVKALFSLFAMAIFANVFDKRTYMPYIHSLQHPSAEEREQQKESDINSIPILERRHYCYTRGLAFDLLHWFFNHHRFWASTEPDGDDNGYISLLSPFTAALGRNMVEYKLEAEEHGHTGFCTAEDFQQQVEMALFAFNGMEEVYDDVQDFSSSFAHDFQDYNVTAHPSPQRYHEPIHDFFNFGKNVADSKYFSALEGQSFTEPRVKLSNIGITCRVIQINCAGSCLCHIHVVVTSESMDL